MVSFIDDARVVIYSFIVLATVITIINYDRTVIVIVNYDCKLFIVQATGDFPAFGGVGNLTIVFYVKYQWFHIFNFNICQQDQESIL